MRWRWILGGAAAIVLLTVGVGAALFLVADRDAGAVSPERALSEFRERPGADRRPAPGLPAAGVYLYRVRGEETLSRGPLSITRTFPAVAPRTIRHTPGGYEVQWRISTGKGELTRVRAGARRSWTVYGESYFSAAGISTTNRRSWEPPQPRAPRTVRVGARWGGRSTDGDGLVVDSESRVTGMRTIRVGGVPVRAAVVETMFTVSGTARGSGSTTTLLDPERELDLRIDTTSDLEQNGSASTRYVATLTSLTPLT